MSDFRSKNLIIGSGLAAVGVAERVTTGPCD